MDAKKHSTEKLSRVPLWAVRIISWLWWTLADLLDRVLQKLGVTLIPLTPESLLEGLSREVRNDALQAELAEPFQLFLQDVQAASYIPLLVRKTLHDFWRRCLTANYKLQCIHNHYPDAFQTPVKKPIFHVGMYRSGTTLVQRLLSLDHRLFTPMLWETMRPLAEVSGGVPEEEPGRKEDFRSNKRYKEMARIMKGTEYLMPDLFLMHECGVEDPEECTLLLMCTLMTPGFILEPRFHVLDKSRMWAYNMTHAQKLTAYRTYKKILQTIGYKNLTHRRWVSKMPFHGLSINELLEVFPDAKILYSHRKLTECVPSYAKLYQSQMCWRGNERDVPELARRSLHHLSSVANNYVKTATLR